MIRMCVTFFPSFPSSLHLCISLSCICKPAFAAAALETLKCNVRVCSRLLKITSSRSLCALFFLSPYMAEPGKASRLHEKQGKHCSQAAEIWHYDTLQAESESAAMWHINLQKKKRRRRRELMRKSIPSLHFSILQKKSICDLLLWKEKLEYNGNPSSSWKKLPGCSVSCENCVWQQLHALRT